MRIGLTGNIAAGKSSVARWLAQQGAGIVDADRCAHKLYEQSPELRQQLAQHFGNRILDSEGQIHRPTLAEIVFKDSQALAELNQIVRPALRSKLEDTLTQTEAEFGLAVLDAPLLFESGWTKGFDSLWLVTAPDDLRLSRAIARGLSPEAALERMHKQMPQAEKIPLCDEHIQNDRELCDIEHQCLEIWERLALSSKISKA